MVDSMLLRARVLVLGSWAINFGCQLYGMLTKPNMKDIADNNHYAFSPNPWFIAAFFSMQTILQLYWIKGFFSFSGRPTYTHKITLPPAPIRNDGNGSSPMLSAYAMRPEMVNEPEPAMMAYAPIYTLGNICIAAWMVFWMQESFWLSQVCVTINTFAQLYAVFYLLSPTSDYAMENSNTLTHLVAKTFAGIGVLDFFDNGAVALRYTGPPSNGLIIIFGLLLLGLTAFSSPARDPTLPLALVYDLVAILAGQVGRSGFGHWRGSLVIVAGLCLVVMAIKVSRQRPPQH